MDKIGTHRDDTHNLCVFCLGKEHARDVLEGKSACTVSFFYVKAPLLVLSLSEERGAAVCFPRFGTHRCRGTEVMKLAVGCGRWVRKKRGTPPFRARRPRTRVSCWIVTMRSFWHNQIQWLVLFSAYERVFGGCESPPARVSLPFFIKSRCGDWEGVKKKKKKLFFLVFIGFSILVMLTLCENGYEGMSPVQEMINSLSLCGRHPLSRLPLAT